MIIFGADLLASPKYTFLTNFRSFLKISNGAEKMKIDFKTTNHISSLESLSNLQDPSNNTKCMTQTLSFQFNVYISWPPWPVDQLCLLVPPGEDNSVISSDVSKLWWRRLRAMSWFLTLVKDIRSSKACGCGHCPIYYSMELGVKPANRWPPRVSHMTLSVYFFRVNIFRVYFCCSRNFFQINFFPNKYFLSENFE